MRVTFLVILLPALILFSVFYHKSKYEEEPIKSVKLFEENGCEVYKFSGQGNSGYYSKCVDKPVSKVE